MLQSWSAFRLAAIAHFVDHPSHVVIETALSLFIIYVLFVKREYNPKKKCGRECGRFGVRGRVGRVH